ncbi:reductase [Mesorhizobium sp. DCY119]|uniref:reductase n=1 Tax=Mesorhizobium sp. DCY119 TaxID=2108445 RepID=UPI001FE1A0D3|nr:reductase [Mesorhizobium sp. DCY119]
MRISLSPVPVIENSPTVAPGPETYSTRKIAMEKSLLDRASRPVTILRLCTIHGPESKHARAWWFVKRLLDGRAEIPLAYRGHSRFQTTSVAAIADALLQAEAGQLPAVANVSDADIPLLPRSGAQSCISWECRQSLSVCPTHLLIHPSLGQRHGRSSANGVRGCGNFRRDLRAIRGTSGVWLVDCFSREKWRERLPQLASYQTDHFDYQADERALQLPGAAALGA